METALASPPYPPSSGSTLYPQGSRSRPGFRNPRQTSPEALFRRRLLPPGPRAPRVQGSRASPRGPGGAEGSESQSWRQTRPGEGRRGDTSDTSEKQTKGAPRGPLSGHHCGPAASPLKPSALPQWLSLPRSERIRFPTSPRQKTCGELSPGTLRETGRENASIFSSLKTWPLLGLH